MKRRLYLQILSLLIILVSLSSCRSASAFGNSSEECDYALHYALERANESVITDLYFKITQTEAFLPKKLSFINEKATEIPGMKKLIAEWAEYMNNYTMQWFEGFRSYVQKLVSNMIFEDPVEIVGLSEDSASQAFETAFGSEIKLYIQQNLEAVDLTKWEEIATQYKAWVTTNKVLFDTEEPQLEELDIIEALAQDMSDLYFSSLKEAEILFRTTPDPNADKTVSKIFGLE